MVKATGYKDKDSEPACTLVWAYILAKLLKRGVPPFPGPHLSFHPSPRHCQTLGLTPYSQHSFWSLAS